MESNKNTMVVVQLNIDVISEILSRLRVKDLLRFKSICKTWLQLISSKQFIKLHINNSRFRPIPLRKEYSIPCHRLFPPFAPSGTLNNMILAGTSSDGLACLLNKKLGIIHIWNPAIRESACIPLKKTPNSIMCFWFGLDDDEDDYKLVLGTKSCQMHLIKPYVDTNSYKTTTLEFRKEDRDNIKFYGELGSLFGGNVHWAVSVFKWDWDRDRDWGWVGQRNVSVKYNVILCYNLREETVGRIALPATRANYRGNELRLGEMAGCLSASFVVKRRYEVWVLKEYGDEESWTKLVVCDSPDLFIGHLSPLERMKSPFYSKELCVESLVSPKRSR